MDGNSKAYKKAIELDAKGYLGKLQKDYKESVEDEPEGVSQPMGSVLTTVAEVATAGLNWLKGDKQSNDDGEEFEIEEPVVHVQTSDDSSETQDDLHEDEATSSVLEKEKSEIKLAIEKMKSHYFPGKSPTFSINLQPDEHERFHVF
ncbi:unnamed protein product [Pieris macdunnoughi]|uniref:Uncharacterized protein n=1 Tax=Pieris macdunnoughi TaxID=345717 RepID=A0A821W800_9NEOP|nr:unnamed protein product [Pieris macdunnoughi]